MIGKELGLTLSEVKRLSVQEITYWIAFLTKVYPELTPGASNDGDSKPSGRKGLRDLLEGRAEIDANGRII